MRRPKALIVVLTTLLCLGTFVAHAITLHVTDDTFIQKESPNVQSGSVASLQVDNRNLSKEHITYALFDLSLVPSDAVLDKAVLRFFVNKVAQAGTLQILVVTQQWTEKTLTWNTALVPASAAVPARRDEYCSGRRGLLYHHRYHACRAAMGEHPFDDRGLALAGRTRRSILRWIARRARVPAIRWSWR